ncbi:MAG: hypothetical protein IKF66_01240 [Methanobrevibacter sp.]|nr:hypothetical protein [Methanobrevibacter sp.]
MTEEELKNKISEHKECCKKLAEEYRQRYNEDRTDKLALNMFYHNVIAYNNFETVLAIIEDRNSMILCFAEPPILTEKTVEVELNRIEELEKACDETQELLDKQIEATYKLDKENAELKARVEKQDADILFLKHLTESLRSQIKALDGQVPWKDIKDKSEELKKELL